MGDSSLKVERGSISGKKGSVFFSEINKDNTALKEGETKTLLSSEGTVYETLDEQEGVGFLTTRNHI